MNEEVKNFDRAIEQMMNESSVAPPFGMWNRISAELDAEALPVAATQAPASFPGRAITGFAAAALVLGISAVSFYFFGNQQNQVFTNAATEISSSTVTTDVNKITPVNNVSAPVLQMEEKTASISVAKEKPAAMVNYMPANLSEAAAILQVKEETLSVTVISIPQESTSTEIVINENSAIADAGEYYFPPVDINVGQLAEESKAAREDLEEEKTVEKKMKASSGSSDKKIKFKKKKSKGFTYGRLNRLKK